jgi:hypothetical protein
MQAALATSPMFAFQSVTASAVARCADTAAQHAAMLNPRRFRFEFRMFMVCFVFRFRFDGNIAQRAPAWRRRNQESLNC